ncbi:hypothetical protein EB796_002651 [Bugula neritina]|uniref:Elongation factor-like GTPase 1 domain-containing protein n=1 Tax=Bugula neritina TaxID=10212 RepID=A0A7J7KLK3_BUGNE|nr:hypothetical protein EB796_002651 [Bugula neritina]
MDRLVKGMRLLNQADSCVQVIVQESGEHVLVAAGEVHLQRCLEDLRKRYCCIAINVSEPIVPFRETIIEPPKHDMVNEAIEGENVMVKNLDKDQGEKLITIRQGAVTLSIEALPLPAAVTALIDSHDNLLQALDHHLSQLMGGRTTKFDRQISLNQQSLDKLHSLRKQIEQLLVDSGVDEWKSLVSRIWCFGPRKYGPNLLINGVMDYNRPSIWAMLDQDTSSLTLREFDGSIVNGFQLATLTGPMCGEPIRGVAFVVRKWEVTHIANPTVSELKEGEETGSDIESDSASVISGSASNLSGSKRSAAGGATNSGQIISSVKEACRRAFQAQPQRIMCAMYSCDIQATANVLGILISEMWGGGVLFQQLSVPKTFSSSRRVLSVVHLLCLTVG